VANAGRLATVIAAIMAADVGEATLPERVCAECVVTLPIAGASLAVRAGGQNHAAHASNSVAGRLSELQYTTGEGPAISACEEDRPVLVPELDAGAARRWPVFVAAAWEMGARSFYSFPLQFGSIRLGMLDMYTTEVGPLPADTLTDALTLADSATLLLLRQPLDDGLDHWAQELLASQAIIHQAAGMLVAQLGADIETAFLRLRAHAFAHERRIGEVAHDIVHRRLRLRDHGDHGDQPS
jgi:hypothetical protein